jgi:hypothetical protein
MRGLKFVLAAALVAISFGSAAPKAEAQVSIGVHIGSAPSCPYGYYGYSPYRCAPYGYYGPEWFVGNGFVGAGPWHRDRFYGHVNRSYDPRYGYRGAYPGRGPYQQHPDNFHSFQGNRYSDARGRYHREEQHSRYEGRR